MRRLLRILGISAGVLVAVLVVFYFYADNHFKAELARTYTAPDFSISSEASPASLALGERIVRVRSGCAHCHGQDLAGKVIIDDPAIGKVFSSNLTPFALAGGLAALAGTAIESLGGHRCGRRRCAGRHPGGDR